MSPAVAATANHEASHAIVDVGLCLTIDHAALLTEGPLAGRVRIVGDDADPQALMAAYLAGPVGDIIREGDVIDVDDIVYHLLDGEEHPDMVEAMAAATYTYSSRGRAWRGLCQSWSRVDRWLRLPASAAAVAAVASTLVDRGSMTGADIYEIARVHGVRVGDPRLLARTP